MNKKMPWIDRSCVSVTKTWVLALTLIWTDKGAFHLATTGARCYSSQNNSGAFFGPFHRGTEAEQLGLRFQRRGRGRGRQRPVSRAERACRPRDPDSQFSGPPPVVIIIHPSNRARAGSESNPHGGTVGLAAAVGRGPRAATEAGATPE
jgi:hypothetical protein